MIMETIKSFTVDHIKLKSGLYVSRYDKAGDTIVTTFDLRMISPYEEEFLDPAAMHTIEHLGATFLRNSEIKDDVIYFGPMGCKTGFYFIVSGEKTSRDIFDLIIAMCDYIIGFKGEIPGAQKVQCGNYLFHDLKGAKAHTEKYKQSLISFKRLEY